jgi:dienelactone hydrolase
MQRLLSGLTVAALALAASAGTTSIGARSTHAAGVRYTDLIFPTVSATADVRYATAPDLVTGVPADLLLDIYEPAGDTVARRPALLAIHGGGFRVGDKGAVADWAREWSQRGYVVFAVNYRLDAGNMCQGLQDGQVPAEELAAEGARCRAAIEAAQYDSQAAVRWVRAHADTYRVDPTRIGAIGSSAGAITAVRLAQRSEFPGDIGDEDTFDSTVGAALAMSGCNNDPSSIDSGDSPVAIIHAENDPAVPFQCTLDTAAAAQADGVVADTMLWYGEATHAINLYRKYQTDIDPVWTAFLIRELHLADGPTPDSMIEIHGTPNRSAIVSLVATQTGGAGYLQALPCDASPGSTSNLNSDAGGQTRAGLAVVHFDSTGTSCVYRSMATEVVVDLQGYFATGQFDDRADTRLLDTRAGQAPAAGAMVVVRAEPNRSAVLSIVATDSSTGRPRREPDSPSSRSPLMARRASTPRSAHISWSICRGTWRPARSTTSRMCGCSTPVAGPVPAPTPRPPSTAPRTRRRSSRSSRPTHWPRATSLRSRAAPPPESPATSTPTRQPRPSPGPPSCASTNPGWRASTHRSTRISSSTCRAISRRGRSTTSPTNAYSTLASRLDPQGRHNFRRSPTAMLLVAYTDALH